MKSRILLSALILLFVGLITQPLFSVNIEDDIVAYWAFNEMKGETASDSSGNGHDGTLIGDPQWVDGYFGGGLEFDQVQDEVNIPYNADLNSEVFTICAWANVEPGSSNHRAVVSSRDDFPQRGFIFYAEPSHNRTYPHFFLNACVVVFIGLQCCHVSSSAVRKFISLKQVLSVNKSNASCVHTSRIIRLMTLITE